MLRHVVKPGITVTSMDVKQAFYVLMAHNLAKRCLFVIGGLMSDVNLALSFMLSIVDFIRDLLRVLRDHID